MEKEFVPYEQAFALKELGFDEPCLGFYWNTGKFYTTAEYSHSIKTHKQNQLGDYDYNSTSAPTWKQAFEFFREKYNLEITTNIIVRKPFSTLPITNTYSFNVVKTDEVSTERINKSIGMVMGIATPEELNIQSLEKLIEIAKKINIGLRI